MIWLPAILVGLAVTAVSWWKVSEDDIASSAGVGVLAALFTYAILYAITA